ncbi:CCA tRNA nucleotidyltransferase [Deinococcus aquiradiocola]|nr:CCA tRNA nucleotidyltransferase [Deinococcus aquiradiocola]
MTSLSPAPDPGAALDARTVWEALPPHARTLLRELRALAVPGARVALVGGAVRDALLGRGSASPDLDLVVAGDDVQRLAGRLGDFVWHPAFRNAALTLPGGEGADLVTARRETYPVPGGSPVPLPGTLEDDLARRDFGLNALALEVTPDGTLALLAVPGGLEDLRARTLRPLHALSLHEDASRLVRAARLAGRLPLHAHPELLAQVPDALGMAARTPRLASELRLLLDEPRPGRAARALSDWGAATLLPEGAADLLERLDALQPGASQSGAAPGGTHRTLYAAALLSLPRGPERLDALALGPKPAELLDRARGDQPARPGTPEHTLRDLLGLTPPYPPLQGRDLLALGVPPGPQVGQLLTRLAQERRAGRYATRDDERRAALTWLDAPQ